MSPQPIYLDANATTPLCAEARAAMIALIDGPWANPSSVHVMGQWARAALDAARESCAASLQCAAKELVFTSGGTESDALALHGTVSAAIAQGRVRDPLNGSHSNERPRPRVVTTTVEHPAVRAACEQLEKRGVEVELVPVDGGGRLDLGALALAVGKPGTVLCSVMAANNETGVLFPLREIAAITRAAGVLLHTDAVQLAGKAAIDLRDLPVELLSLSAHKFGGPKGAGLLFVRRGVTLLPFVAGGHQERGLRGGTENPTAAQGLAAALAQAQRVLSETQERVRGLRDRLERAVAGIPGAQVLGREAPRVANTLCAVFADVSGEELLVALDLEGVAVSTGSACSSGTLEPSPVLLAMGVPVSLARGAVRFSLWSGNTEDELERVCALLPEVVARLRRR
ncbi:MAG: cysteine desulfurase [Deltaproteobacteria bacterium]|nr:cysteine desulfurase [Deltaproteobacteria bacterium]